MLAIRLPQEVEQRLDSLSRLTGRTKTYYAREAIIEHLDTLEELYLAESELEKIRAGAKTYSIKEVEQELGLEG